MTKDRNVKHHIYGDHIWLAMICILLSLPGHAQEYSSQQVVAGRMLFTGSEPFENGGPSCLSCHHVTNNEVISGGSLAKDLTNVYARMGDAGISGILGAPPFPAMSVSYNENNRLTNDEILQLTAFLQYTDKVSDTQEQNSGNKIFFLYGFLGLIIWLILIYIVWFKRKKLSVKHHVFERQIKAIN